MFSDGVETLQDSLPIAYIASGFASVSYFLSVGFPIVHSNVKTPIHVSPFFEFDVPLHPHISLHNAAAEDTSSPDILPH
jgi:hypothetical protein